MDTENGVFSYVGLSIEDRLLYFDMARHHYHCNIGGFIIFDVTPLLALIPQHSWGKRSLFPKK